MKTKRTSLSFSKRFLWGASVSTHQVEGGNNNQWTQWEQETAKVKTAQASYKHSKLPIWPEIEKEATTAENYISGQACDHFNRYEHDFDLAKQLHLNTLRSGIEWSRIEPEEGVFDQVAIAHYKKYFSQLRKRDITPVITLWHWSNPIWFEAKGGFLKRRNLHYFRRYVKHVTEQLGTHFEIVLTINEPTTFGAQGYHEAVFPPQKESKIAMIRVIRNLMRAHRQSYKIIKKMRPSTKVGMAHNCTYFYAGDDSKISAISAWLGKKFGNEWAINQVRGKQDFLGFNFYWSQRICGTRIHSLDGRANDLGWHMEPANLEKLMVQLHSKYNLPLMITESGVADRHDTNRQWWISEEIKAIDRAIKVGVPTLGYIHWSLLDNFEWAEGFWPRFGLIEVDFKTQQRKVRPSARWYGQFIKMLEDSR